MDGSGVLGLSRGHFLSWHPLALALVVVHRQGSLKLVESHSHLAHRTGGLSSAPTANTSYQR